MASITAKISDKVAREFREFAVKKKGTMRGLSEMVEEALIEYLKNHEHDMENGKVARNPLMALTTEPILA